MNAEHSAESNQKPTPLPKPAFPCEPLRPLWFVGFLCVLRDPHADVNELVEKLGAAEIAIQDRLNDQPSDQLEVACLRHALATLLDIKKTKLHLG